MGRGKFIFLGGRKTRVACTFCEKCNVGSSSAANKWIDLHTAKNHPDDEHLPLLENQIDINILEF